MFPTLEIKNWCCAVFQLTAVHFPFAYTTLYYIMKMIELPATQFKRGIFSATTAGNLKQKLLLKCAKDHDQN